MRFSILTLVFFLKKLHRQWLAFLQKSINIAYLCDRIKGEINLLSWKVSTETLNYTTQVLIDCMLIFLSMNMRACSYKPALSYYPVTWDMFNQSKLTILLSVFHVYLLFSECYYFLIYTIDCLSFILKLYFWTLNVKLKHSNDNVL